MRLLLRYGAVVLVTMHYQLLLDMSANPGRYNPTTFGKKNSSFKTNPIASYPKGGTIDYRTHGIETPYLNMYVTSFPAYSPLIVFEVMKFPGVFVKRVSFRVPKLTNYF